MRQEKEIPFDKELANSTIAMYSNDTIFNFNILSPNFCTSTNLRIQITHKKYKRTIIACSLEEFFDIIEMYSCLSDNNTVN